MEFWLTILTLLKRRRVIIPTILVGAVLGGTAFLMTPVYYVSSTTMVLTTTEYGGTESRDPAQPTDLTNPMLNFNDSLTTTSAILIQAMNTKAVAKQLGAAGSADLVIDDGRSNPDLLGLNGPFIYIAGRSTSPEQAQQLVTQAQQLMRDKLVEWQKALKAPQKTYVGLVDVVSPTAPTADRSEAVKYALLAFVGGLLLCLGFAYFRYRIHARRLARPDALPSGEDTATVDDLPDRAPRLESSSTPVLVPDLGDHGSEPDAALPVPVKKLRPRRR